MGNSGEHTKHIPHYSTIGWNSPKIQGNTKEVSGDYIARLQELDINSSLNVIKHFLEH